MTAAVLTPPERDINWTRVVRAQSGDREAFADIYRTYRPMIAGWIYKRTRDVDLTDDLTADVFARALRNIGTVTWQGKEITAWLHTIARNLLADHWKSARVRLAADCYGIAIWDTADGPVEVWNDHGQVDDDPMSDPAIAAEIHVSAVHTLNVLWPAITALTEEQRQVIVMRFFDGLSPAEIAAATGRTVGAIKMVQHRALRALARDESVAALAGAA